MMQAAGLYASMLAFAVVVVAATPGYLKRPVALGLTALGLVLAATVFRPPAGLVWLPLLYYLKLVAGHAVPDASTGCCPSNKRLELTARG
jgi:hypothetical protein